MTEVREYKGHKNPPSPTSVMQYYFKLANFDPVWYTSTTYNSVGHTLTEENAMLIVFVSLGIVTVAIILAILATRQMKRSRPPYPLNDCPICGAKNSLQIGKCVVCGYDQNKMI